MPPIGMTENGSACSLSDSSLVNSALAVASSSTVIVETALEPSVQVSSIISSVTVNSGDKMKVMTLV